jgi:hypothetical protein
VVLVAGVLLVAGGALCLYLSDAVAPADSWEASTLDAFGVGFVVGGVVDVTAISLLDGILTDLRDREQALLREKRKNQLEAAAERLLKQGETTTGRQPLPWELDDVADSIKQFLDRDGDQVGGATPMTCDHSGTDRRTFLPPSGTDLATWHESQS